jgi:hypothetical protein
MFYACVSIGNTDIMISSDIFDTLNLQYLEP